MAARREIEPHERIARLQQREEHGLVGLTARIRLDVGEAAVKQFGGALDRELFGDVDELAAAIITPADIALGVFVGHHRALRLQHRLGDDVLRGDQLDLVALATKFEFDRARDLGIGGGEIGGEERIRADGRCVHGSPCGMIFSALSMLEFVAEGVWIDRRFVCMMCKMKSADLIRELEKQGWRLVRVRGSHHIFKHPQRRGQIVVPHPKADLGRGLLAAILRQARE